MWSDDPEDWRPINHSCDPTAWLDGLDVVARRPIAAGEEVTLDYATFYGEAMPNFACTCGAADCRGTVRGADHLEYTGAPGEIPNLAVIRFHLHPKVTAAMLANGSVLMKIRGSRVGWTFKADGAVTEIDNSVYFEDGVRQASQQIVLKAVVSDIRTTGSHEIRWAFTRGAQ